MHPKEYASHGYDHPKPAQRGHVSKTMKPANKDERTKDDFRCSVMTRRNNGRVILFFERRRTEIYEANIRGLKYPFCSWRSAALSTGNLIASDLHGENAAATYLSGHGHNGKPIVVVHK